MDKISIVDMINIISPMILLFVGYVLKGLNDSMKEFKMAVTALRQDLTNLMSTSARGEQDIVILKRDLDVVMKHMDEQRRALGKMKETISLLRTAHNACELSRVVIEDNS
jgi:hypothetical protein